VRRPAPPEADGELTLDRLPHRSEPVQVARLTGLQLDGTGAGVREPHRHDYHELLWLRSGRGEHLLDGRPLAVRPHSLTLIGRGQVHVFNEADGVHGLAVRFADEALLGGAAQRATPGWMLAGRGGLSVEVPGGDVARLEADFRRHHDAAHYADALGVPAAALSRALSHVTGRATKELITDRVMLQAARLLRVADLTVQEIGHRTGCRDPLYFSRAFKRHQGESPQAYRARVQGKSMHP